MSNDKAAVFGKDLTGLRFGRLVARSQLPPLYPRDGFRWICVCDCGEVRIVKTRLLTYKSGTRSCGCITADLNRAKPKNRPSTNIKHGHASRGPSPEYVTWSSMIQRCTNPKHPSFANYGGRGIEVCQPWLCSFDRFLEDMGPKPTPRHSIDRIDNDKGYEPENCRWASKSEQLSNKRNNVYCVVHGDRLVASEAARKFAIPSRTLYGWIASKKYSDLGEKITSYLAKRR